MANELSTLTVPAGSRRRKFRVGRGLGSGNGKTAGRGTKGQKSRSGAGVSPGFEGGQMPLQRRLPKRGFVNRYAKPVEIVHVGQLDRLSSHALINRDVLTAAGLVSGRCHVKLLADGEVTKVQRVEVDFASASAIAKVVAAGGKVEVV